MRSSGSSHIAGQKTSVEQKNAADNKKDRTGKQAVRLFIAIQLNRRIKDAVTDVQDAFRMLRVGGNYTPRENLHLTLAFIGEYSDPERVLEVMQSVRFRPFAVTLDKVGCFDGIWWAGLAENPELDGLVRKLRHALADAGIPFDRKRFRAHITFLRKPYGTEGKSIPQGSAEPAGMEVRQISLMRSDRGKGGMVYTALGSCGCVEPEGDGLNDDRIFL